MKAFVDEMNKVYTGVTINFAAIGLSSMFYIVELKMTYGTTNEFIRHTIEIDNDKFKKIRDDGTALAEAIINLNSKNVVTADQIKTAIIAKAFEAK